MCGIAGVARREAAGVSPQLVLQMLSAIRHRGPDGFGYFTGDRVGLGHVRLSIVDVKRGAQPLANEDGQVLITYNGEVYNHHELRIQLEGLGHRFRTRCDTEVLVHAWEEWGPAMLSRLNGQFAFAIYDRRSETVFLARDRFGVRPLFYSIQGGDLYFGSEAKALFASGEVDAAPDIRGLDEVFTFWAVRPPRTPFAGVLSLEPGTYGIWREGRLRIERYYQLDYPEADAEPEDAIARLDEIMRSSVQLRMRADVPVGGYLSGGLDSSITCSLAAAASPHELRTFSVTFDDPRLDESEFQQIVAGQIGSRHAVQRIGGEEIAAVFPDVIRHTETPLVRTGPAPLYLLSKLTRERDIKVVLTGEGADELFLGYDLFKETRVRLFCNRQPGSSWRSSLFDRLYPYLDQGASAGAFWRRFFLTSGGPEDPLFSHLPRILLTSRIKEFYSAEMRAGLEGADPLQELRDSLPEAFGGWSPLHRAAYLEMVTLLSPYLLSSQGDRVGMAHAVEGRFPFLDHRLFEYAAALPASSKLKVLREKDVLRRWSAPVVPRAVGARPKQPYRAPDSPAFFGAKQPAYVEEMLDAGNLQRGSIFDARAVAGLVKRCRDGKASGFRENQALVAILSTQLWQQQMLGSNAVAPLAAAHADVAWQDVVNVAA